jgi:hypothetical protein
MTRPSPSEVAAELERLARNLCAFRDPAEGRNSLGAWVGQHAEAILAALRLAHEAECAKLLRKIDQMIEDEP